MKMCYEMLSCLVTESEEYKIGKSLYILKTATIFHKKAVFGSRSPLAVGLLLNCVPHAVDLCYWMQRIKMNICKSLLSSL